MHTYYNKRPLGPRGSLLPCELKCLSNRSVPPTAPAQGICFNRNPRLTPRHLRTSIYRGLSSRQQHSLHLRTGGPLIGRGPPACALYRPTLNGGQASDWLSLSLANGRATNYQRVRTNQVVDTRPEYTCLSIPPAIPSSRRGSSHVSSQGKEAASVTHDTLPQVVKASALYYKTRKTNVQYLQ